MAEINSIVAFNICVFKHLEVFDKIKFFDMSKMLTTVFDVYVLHTKLKTSCRIPSLTRTKVAYLEPLPKCRTLRFS